MKKNPGRKERRASMHSKEDKYSIALECVHLKKKLLKNKHLTVEQQASINSFKFIASNMDGYSYDGICQFRAKLKRQLIKK